MTAIARTPTTVTAAAEPCAALPPLLGEHSLEILESLRYGEEARERLVENRTVVVPDFEKAIWARVRPAGE